MLSLINWGMKRKKERQEKLRERKEAEEDFKKTATIAAVNTANRGRGRGSVAERGRNASNRGRQSVGRNIANAFRRSERAIEISSSDDSEEEDLDSNSSNSSSDSTESQTDGDSQLNSDNLDSHVPGINGARYGGFGRCFNCNRR